MGVWILVNLFKLKVLLVVGGRFNDEFRTSTEIQLTRSSTWTSISGSEYPAPLAGLRGMTIDNVVYMSGLINHISNIYISVYNIFFKEVLYLDVISVSVKSLNMKTTNGKKLEI